METELNRTGKKMETFPRLVLWLGSALIAEAKLVSNLRTQDMRKARAHV